MIHRQFSILLMLHEFLTSLTTPCPTHLRALGYLYEAIALRGRYRRNRAAWQPHLDNSRRFVLAAAERCSDKGNIVILGSGLLLDVPLAELSALFREVVLMDVICLPEVRRQIRKYDNVHFVEHDATNIAERLYWNGQERISELPEPAPDTSVIDQNSGLVVSLNILSQLWVVPRAYAANHLRALTEDQVEEWCGRLVASHYDYLRSLPCDVCLVADHEFVKRDQAGQVISRDSTVYGLELPKPDDSWIWNIGPIGKDSRFMSKELIVGAWYFQGRNEVRRL
ncbi:MAG: hypothetical protein A2X56_04310 [Nitrospirae bacterium GWC2_57_13]|nr:MAG: hypothetical protein A2072_06220 [Nitrospirae bacterium GWC1_57_7]OGW26673.1 MAG: hypothetical protein A2X56_04310 [Nitrospirae bacterium GWC2_57_13]HAR45033.1 hypothetical protein [Nitrospiraceae bacterium]